MFRILSLDGGGPWALLQAMALERIFGNRGGHDILARFDLAVANSGGSIVLAGLVKGMTPRQIYDLFMTEAVRRSIFKRRTAPEKILDDITADWDGAAKLVGLRAVMDDGPNKVADLTLREAALRIGAGGPGLMVAAFDVDRNRGLFFRSFPSDMSAERGDPFEPRLCDAVHASTHAPVFYFSDCAHVSSKTNPGDRRRFWDGALAGLNNPVLGGVLEARVRGEAEIAALSLGTGAVWKPLARPETAIDRGLVADPAPMDLLASVKRVAGAILDDPPDNATRDGFFLTDGRLVRLNPMIRPVRNAAGVWGLDAGYAALDGGDGVRAFTTLAQMPMDAVRPDQVALIARMGLEWMAGRIQNQPILWSPIDGTGREGHTRFDDAVNAWRLLDPGAMPPQV